MAESEGFEPSERLPVHTISNRAPSTTQPTLYVIVMQRDNISINLGFWQVFSKRMLNIKSNSFLDWEYE